MKCIVVDDEPLARERLEALLGAEADVELAASCGDGPSAATAIAAHGPDVVFLDIQLPGMDGLALARALGGSHRPLVVFVTAYDEFAVGAFELGAVDYLLKPFGPERFQEALGRVRDRLARAPQIEVGALVDALRQSTGGPAPERGQILVKSGDRVRVVQTAEVAWICSEGNYVRLHFGPEATALVRGTLEQVMAQLGAGFIRTHRSAAARLNAIRELRQPRDGRQLALLSDGSALPVGRKYRAALEARLRRGR
jgi:two-component system, LytTR family, response regulator